MSRRSKARRRIAAAGGDAAPAHRLALAAAAGVALITLLTFAPVRHFDFVNYDDLEFVVENPHIATGINAANLRWVVRNAYAAAGGPITWLSHLADVEISGLDAGGHHLTSLAMHTLNAVLLFGWLWRTTGAVWRSAFVSALFAVHPLHVESVAWIAQRKDVLSTLFWLLTMIAYTSYARRPRTSRYLVTAGLFALGLLSKPMVVTLPIVLLLLDIWPLGRLSLDRPIARQAVRLGVEKVPLVLMAAGAGALTIVSQRALGAVTDFEALPLSVRLSNALVSYLAYIGKMFWPAGLVPYYPYREAVPIALVAACAAALAAATAAALAALRRAPFVTVGWLWYVVTLVPVIGLVQVGGHAMADRFTYVPLVGLFVALTWLGAEGWRRTGAPVWIGAAAAAGIVVATAATARAQARHWRDGIALWEHTTRVTPRSARAHANLGVALARQGRDAAAVAHYEEALRLAPSAEAHNNLALALVRTGRDDEALEHARAAVRMKPDYVNARSNLGGLLASAGRKEEAVEHYARAVQLQPDHVLARVGLALALHDTGRAAEAMPHALEAVRLQPGEARWHYVAGVVLAGAQRPAEAAAQFEAALRIDPGHDGARRAFQELRQRRN